MQMLNVAAFAVSGYSSTKARTCKPFNPLLGETYEADYPDKGLRFISGKVKTEIKNLDVSVITCGYISSYVQFSLISWPIYVLSLICKFA
jgi:hypothetical protein